ncbi:hypothetical protein ABE10_01650, partial [Bacillus toyonensis]|nr:hypothetical protein [Bacillus toyonensis]
GRRRGRTGKAEPEGLGDRCHRVGGVHAAARALAGSEGTFDALQVLLAHASGTTRADALEGVDDRDVLLGAVRELDPARGDRAGVEEDAGEAEASARHQHPRDGLVAAGEKDRPVEALCHDDRLDGVGDDLARHEREVHPLVSHGDAVRDGDRAELQRIPATGVDPLLR